MRSLANWSATRRRLLGVSSISLILGRLPWASWRAPSATMPPAMPVAIQPSRASRVPRPLGTASVAAPLDGSLSFFKSGGLQGCPLIMPERALDENCADRKIGSNCIHEH